MTRAMGRSGPGGTRYDRCADLFLSACCLGAVVLYWL